MRATSQLHFLRSSANPLSQNSLLSTKPVGRRGAKGRELTYSFQGLLQLKNSYILTKNKYHIYDKFKIHLNRAGVWLSGQAYDLAQSLAGHTACTSYACNAPARAHAASGPLCFRKSDLIVICLPARKRAIGGFLRRREHGI